MSFSGGFKVVLFLIVQRKFQRCFNSISMVVKERFKAFQENLKGVHVSVKDVSRAFHENFNRGSRLFQRYFKDF